MDEKISVIVPVYKVEIYLRRCVDSILRQTYRALEIILVDDGSPDGCPAICDEYAGADGRVRVVHKSNGGLSDARNAGLAIATGAYIAFVDSDDYIVPDMYEKMLRRMKRDGADLAMTGIQYVDEDGTVWERREPFARAMYTGREILREMTYSPYGYYFIVAWNKLYARRLFDGVRFPFGRTHEDEFLIPRLFMAAEKITVSNDPDYMYVQRPSSIMGMGRPEGTVDAAEALMEQVSLYRENGLDTLLQLLQGKTVALLSYVAAIKKKSPALEKRYAAARKQYFDTFTMSDLGLHKKMVHICFVLYPPGVYLWRKFKHGKQWREGSGGQNALKG